MLPAGLDASAVVAASEIPWATYMDEESAEPYDTWSGTSRYCLCEVLWLDEPEGAWRTCNGTQCRVDAHLCADMAPALEARSCANFTSVESVTNPYERDCLCSNAGIATILQAIRDD